MEQGQLVGQAAVVSHETGRDWSATTKGGQSSKGAWDGAFPSRCSLYFLHLFAFVADSSPGLALLPPSRYSPVVQPLFQRGDLCGS